jgi:hypothetical protein
VTVPLGGNTQPDPDLAKDRLGFDEKRLLTRISRDHRWREFPRPEAVRASAPSQFPAANVVAVCSRPRR